MASYTLLGQELWLWAPWLALSTNARMTWLALLTSPNAKRTPPGLWNGSALVLAEQAHMPNRDVHDALVELVDQRLIEHDESRRVISMTRLPDRCERPSNGSLLKKWWNLFRGVPPCAVRDGWVRLLHWLCQPWNKSHEEVWPVTFGSVLPMSEGPTTVCDQPVDKQCALVFSGTPDTLPDTLPDTPRIRMRDQDLGSGIRDQDLRSGWAPPPAITGPHDNRPAHHSAAPTSGSCPTELVGGFIVYETQEHDANGQPWGPEGPPRDRFINGRRRNL